MKAILDELMRGNLSIINIHSRLQINQSIVDILNTDVLTPHQISELDCLVRIGNILYNNLPNEFDNPIEDGVYDLLLEKYKQYDANYQVGSIDVELYDTVEENNSDSVFTSPINVVSLVDNSKSMLYDDDILLRNYNGLSKVVTLLRPYNEENTRLVHNVSHTYPKLSGTLDKCKFVLDKQALDADALDKPNVKIFERDFIRPHVEAGIINPNYIRMIGTLKYDGVSVVCIIKNGVCVSAYSRGETKSDLASDLTHIFKGYIFPNAIGIEDEIGVQFEAVMTYEDLQIYCNIRNKSYDNCRTAIISLFTALDGSVYRDLITLVPIKTSIENIDRLVELELLNSHFATREYLRNTYMEGDYLSVLFQVKSFVDECERYRNILPIMYDGVVLEYIDPQIISILGRTNSVNKYSVAIKFSTLKKYTMVTNVDYTIGQNGTVTPIVYYSPVEFLGTIHTKTTLSSKARFDKLQLRLYDIIQIEYVNDVIPYATKPDIEYNRNNPNPLIEFPTVCKYCGHELVGKDDLRCPNVACPERNVNRITNFFNKLSLKGFSYKTFKKIHARSLKDLFNLTKEDIVNVLGPVNSDKLLYLIDIIRTNPIEDYKLVGALGFTSTAEDKWKKILAVRSLSELINGYNIGTLDVLLRNIHGIGKVTIGIIKDEIPYFLEDLIIISNLPNVIETKGSVQAPKICMTGFRDKLLIDKLRDVGFEYKDNLTKDTFVLLVPNGEKDHESTKTAKAKKMGIKIMELDEFLNSLQVI